MLKAIVILNGAGGELDRREVSVLEGRDGEEALSNAIHTAIANSGWRLDPGDTIEIHQA